MTLQGLRNFLQVALWGNSLTLLGHLDVSLTMILFHDPYLGE